jgi:hypothetical protein
MLRPMLLLLVTVFSCAADPAILHVQVHNGKYLTFSIENNYESPVIRFEVAVKFPGTGLTCGLTADVKRPEDLHPPGTCGLPVNMTNGQVERPNWQARIVTVDFADGMRWSSRP